MTIWAAKSVFQEKERGSLEVGKNADFIILNQDLMNIDEKDIKKRKFCKTWVDGTKNYNQKSISKFSQKLSGRTVSLDIIEKAEINKFLKKKKIAYIELDTHAEIALNFMELMNDSKAFSVDYYFSEKILRFFGFAQNDKLPENKKSNQKILSNNYQPTTINSLSSEQFIAISMFLRKLQRNSILRLFVII